MRWPIAHSGLYDRLQSFVPCSCPYVFAETRTLRGSWFRSDRGRAERGKTHDFGGNIQALTRAGGFPIWISPVEPGSVHDLTAARAHVLGALDAAASRGLPTLADPGYEGAGIGVHTPVKQPADGSELDINTRTRNMLLRSLRCLGERGFALLVGRWRTLQHVTVSPSKISKIARAALVLTHFEHGYLTC